MNRAFRTRAIPTSTIIVPTTNQAIRSRRVGSLSMNFLDKRNGERNSITNDGLTVIVTQIDRPTDAHSRFNIALPSQNFQAEGLIDPPDANLNPIPTKKAIAKRAKRL